MINSFSLLTSLLFLKLKPNILLNLEKNPSICDRLPYFSSSCLATTIITKNARLKLPIFWQKNMLIMLHFVPPFVY